jgi:predicted dehydrogenase
MGRRFLRVIQGLGLRLTGICDQSPDTLKLVSAEHQIPAERCYADAARLLKETQPECVVVATTAPSHSVVTCLAAEAGVKYILCEKPMATSLAECDRMLEVCARHRVRLAVDHQMRFMPQYVEPKRIVQSERFGGLGSVTVVAGNIGMSMNGTHYVEMFRYMTDETPEEIVAWFSPKPMPNPRGPHFQDQAGAVRVTTPSGKRLYMELGADQGHGATVIYAGRYGQLIVDDLVGTMRLSVREAQHRMLPTTRYAMPQIEEFTQVTAGTLKPTQDVLEALLSDGDDAPSGEVGRLAVTALVAAYVSHERGHRPVRMDGELPRARIFPWA